MKSVNYGDPNDSDSMTAPSVRLNNRLYAGSRFSDGISEEFDIDSRTKGFKQVGVSPKKFKTASKID